MGFDHILFENGYIYSLTATTHGDAMGYSTHLRSWSRYYLNSEQDPRFGTTLIFQRISVEIITNLVQKNIGTLHLMRFKRFICAHLANKMNKCLYQTNWLW
jgi:hypothetical protein